MASQSPKTAQTPEKPQNNVLIAGAGPVGLAIALRFALAGIVVDVVEKESRLGEEPRAVAYYASALIALNKMGVKGGGIGNRSKLDQTYVGQLPVWNIKRPAYKGYVKVQDKDSITCPSSCSSPSSQATLCNSSRYIAPRPRTTRPALEYTR